MELNYTFWQENDGWYLGFLDEYPEYWTQGKSINELEEMLLDIYKNEQEAEPREIPKRQMGKIVMSVAWKEVLFSKRSEKVKGKWLP